jgi:hypothetical protein
MIQLGHSDLLDSPTLDLATASPVLSVVYATEKDGENADAAS